LIICFEQLVASLEKELDQAKASLEAEKNSQEEVEANLSKLKNLLWKLVDAEGSKKALSRTLL
jgi:predicted Zn-dependent peptidase